MGMEMHLQLSTIQGKAVPEKNHYTRGKLFSGLIMAQTVDTYPLGREFPVSA
jgi:hypothetical protein